MNPTKSFLGVSRERVREVLSLADWQVDLAADTGLLQRADHGRFDQRSVTSARTAGRAWLAQLAVEYRLNTVDAAKRLQCSAKVFERLAAEHGLAVILTAHGRCGPTRFYRAGDVDGLADAVNSRRGGRQAHPQGRSDLADIAKAHKVSLSDATAAARSVQARVQRGNDGSLSIASSREQDVRRALDEIGGRGAGRQRTATKARAEAEKVSSRVSVYVRDRRDAPKLVTLHLGPTNSGKTYDALQRLAAARSGVYAAPLRMLAREAYAKLCDQIGEEHVGLITGEEEINGGAPVLCCTAEMAPMSGTTLVVDEAHWAADRERGYAWTRLLVGGTYDTIEVAASAGAAGFLNAVFSDVPNLTTVVHNRLSPLTYGGDINLKSIPDRSLVVAFSRKAVHTLARRLLDEGRTVGVLYGLLPPHTRVAQIEQFMSGEVDVLVVTDVVGHGINTPASAVVIAQTDKYDGAERRDLRIWEVAQITGRAGRYGLAGAGQVFTLAGQGGFNPKSDLVAAGTRAAAGDEPDGLRVERGLLRPTIRDLGVPESHQIGVALTAWGAVAAVELVDRPGVEAIPIAALYERWVAAGAVVGVRVETAGLTREWPIDGGTVWQVLTTPVDVESPVFAALIKSLVAGRDKLEDVIAQARNGAGSTLGFAEEAAGIARDLLVIARLFPDIRGGLTEEAQQLEAKATATIAKRLAQSLRTSTCGTCDECGEHCAPHFSRCDPCFNMGRSPAEVKNKRR